jgi:glycosyltransferase involved in cell wall biosynthesis
MEVNIKKKHIETSPLKILFQVWWQIPHSYAVVSCFQIIHLYKNFGPEGKISKNKVDIYIEEMPYFRPEWNNNKKLVYTEEYNNILKNLKKHDHTKFVNYDLIYRQTYPYNITVTEENINIPKCVFYTSEFKDYLTPDYFTLNPNIPKADNVIIQFLEQFKDTFYFTSPSDWSSKGMVKYLPNETLLNGQDFKRNRIITHGVDTTFFYKTNDTIKRKQIRDLYKVTDDDILLMSIGAMTKNKGIIQILQVLNVLVHKLQKTHYKLLLKGTGDLYQSKMFLEAYFEELVNANVISASEIDNLYKNHIIFTDKTLSYSTINDLYNASDLYIAPYLAEGFGLTPLEALASGLNVLVPETGSTKEYMELLYNNGGTNFIYYMKSDVIQLSNGMSQNNIDVNELFKALITFENNLFKERRGELDKSNDYLRLKETIGKELSWNKVSELLVEYFEDIIYKN